MSNEIYCTVIMKVLNSFLRTLLHLFLAVVVLFVLWIVFPPATAVISGVLTGAVYHKAGIVVLHYREKEISVRSIMRKPMYVPETMKTDEVLDIMKKSRKHMAIVVDEYGGTAGLVTLEDLIEEIIGDIQDEYDKETPDIIKERDGSYIVQGQVNLEDLSEALGYPFDNIFEEVDTLAGMILEITGNFPSSGQVVAYGPWEIKALNVQNHRILEARIKYIGENKENDEEKQQGAGR